MNTKSNRLRGAAAAVSGARHLRIARNGQDAAAVWISPGGHPRDVGVVDGAGVVVVSDGCGSGESSEVGARLGAQLVLRAITRGLQASCPPARQDSLDGAPHAQPADNGLLLAAASDAFWVGVRTEVVAALDDVVRAMSGEREQIVHDYFLFTAIAAVMVGEAVVVWAIGDGAYAIDGRVRELGPFENNQPPYLGYDLLDGLADTVGDRFVPSRLAHVEVTRGNSVIVATDGVAEIGLDHFAGVDRFVAHPDALRRHLALLARGTERIDWDARRVIKTPALLQDDGAVAMLVRTPDEQDRDPVARDDRGGAS